MAVYTNTTAQSVTLGSNVIFTNSYGCGCNVTHSDGSGQFILHGGRRYLVSFNGNITGATAGTEVDLAIAINGEPIKATLMASTPAVAEDSNNVSATTVISVPNCCCYILSVQNAGTTANTVNTANLVIKREA